MHLKREKKIDNPSPKSVKFDIKMNPGVKETPKSCDLYKRHPIR